MINAVKSSLSSNNFGLIDISFFYSFFFVSEEIVERKGQVIQNLFVEHNNLLIQILASLGKYISLDRILYVSLLTRV
jgi:hypothetical protein